MIAKLSVVSGKPLDLEVITSEKKKKRFYSCAYITHKDVSPDSEEAISFFDYPSSCRNCITKHTLKHSECEWFIFRQEREELSQFCEKCRLLCLRIKVVVACENNTTKETIPSMPNSVLTRSELLTKLSSQQKQIKLENRSWI